MPFCHISLHHAPSANISKSEIKGEVISAWLIVYIVVTKTGFKETEYPSIKMGVLSGVHQSA